MRYVDHPAAAGLGVPVSALGFGCASLMGKASRKESLRALAAAADAGVTLFDTARSYGFGASEGVLGEFLAGRRDRAVVCTKFGILPEAAGWKTLLKPAVRGAVRLVPSLGRAVRKQAGRSLVQSHFSANLLQQSLETSLRELRTDYVDILLMHAAPASALEAEDLLDALTHLVKTGTVRMAGISGTLEVMSRVYQAPVAPLVALQFSVPPPALAFTEQSRMHPELLQMANHPFGGAEGVAGLRKVLTQLAADPATPAALRDRIDPRDPASLPRVVMQTLTRGTGIPIAVSSMLQPAHVQGNTAALEESAFSNDEVAWLRRELVARFAGRDAG